MVDLLDAEFDDSDGELETIALVVGEAAARMGGLENGIHPEVVTVYVPFDAIDAYQAQLEGSN